jgi:hypothetical protein
MRMNRSRAKKIKKYSLNKRFKKDYNIGNQPINLKIYQMTLSWDFKL